MSWEDQMRWDEHPAAPADGTVLCRFDELSGDDGREVVIGAGDDPLRLLVVRRGDQAFAYMNCCPHHYIPLAEEGETFLTYDRSWMICSAHGAVFRYEDGFCEDGPCMGKSLQAVPVEQVDGVVRIKRP